jgi:hypothetical protein
VASYAGFNLEEHVFGKSPEQKRMDELRGHQRGKDFGPRDAERMVNEGKASHKEVGMLLEAEQARTRAQTAANQLESSNSRGGPSFTVTKNRNAKTRTTSIEYDRVHGVISDAKGSENWNPVGVGEYRALGKQVEQSGGRSAAAPQAAPQSNESLAAGAERVNQSRDAMYASAPRVNPSLGGIDMAADFGNQSIDYSKKFTAYLDNNASQAADENKAVNDRYNQQFAANPIKTPDFPDISKIYKDLRSSVMSA